LFNVCRTLHILCSLSRFEAIPDKLSPDEILQQAENAAEAAADKLASRVPNSKVRYIQQL